MAAPTQGAGRERERVHKRLEGRVELAHEVHIIYFGLHPPPLPPPSMNRGPEFPEEEGEEERKMPSACSRELDYWKARLPGPVLSRTAHDATPPSSHSISLIFRIFL